MQRGNDLPVYPTPGQAAYVVGSPPGSGRKTSSSSYKPPPASSSHRGGSQPYQQKASASANPNYHHVLPHSQSFPQHIRQYQQPLGSSSGQYQNSSPAQYLQPNSSSGHNGASQYLQQNAGSGQYYAQQQHYAQQPSPPVQYAQTPQYQPQPTPQAPQQQAYSQYHQQDYQQQQPQRSYTPQQQPQYSTSPTASSHTHKKPPPAMAHHRSRENLLIPEPQHAKVPAKQKLENELRLVFEKVDVNRSGRISAKELSLALLNFDHTRFQDSTILLMIKLFSTSGAAGSTPLTSLNFDQFVSLWKYLSAYKKLFLAADTNKSGDISFGELQQIIEQIGYKLNIDLVLHLFQKFSYKDLEGSYDGASVGKLKFDAFIELLVYLRKLTDVFKKYDKDLSGVATINFLDFLFEVSSLN